MNDQCTLQLHAAGVWSDVATLLRAGPEADGWRAHTYATYSAEWALEHMGKSDAWAVGNSWPVGMALLKLEHWPPPLIDLLPQGSGRAELLRQLGLPETAEARADWTLLMHGAGNPIGNLRVKEAAEHLQRQATVARGFSDDEVARRSPDFVEYLSGAGLYVAGSSGVQGEWPKLLLTRARDGLLYLDHALPDSEASQHYLVKFSRGENPQLAAILRNEAPYMRLAQRLGLRVHGMLEMRERALFIPRFDRVLEGAGVTRLAQESLASFMGRAGFGVKLSHDEVCLALAARSSAPLEDVAEYICRDIANVALGNRDNHARNTAVLRGFAGQVRLSPLYDFAPMYLHPDGVARQIRWNDNDGGKPDWAHVLDTVSASCGLPRPALVERIQPMAAGLRAIALEGLGLGLEKEVFDFVLPGLLEQAAQLEALR